MSVSALYVSSKPQHTSTSDFHFAAVQGHRDFVYVVVAYWESGTESVDRSMYRVLVVTHLDLPLGIGRKLFASSLPY